MRELKTTLRNGNMLLREPPLHNLNNQIDSQILTDNNLLFSKKMETSDHFKNGAESKSLMSRNLFKKN